MLKTKIICTLGPATDEETVIRGMMLAGMNAARLNFSHGTHEDHARRVLAVKRLREELGLPIALLMDTKGPEVRLGKFKKGKVSLSSGQSFTLTTENVEGDESRCSVSFPNLPREIARGTRILIDDGLIELVAESVSPFEIVCTVQNGGVISSLKSINIPGENLSMPFISSADRADLRFAAEQGFDVIAASFTRRAEDVLEMREELRRLNCSGIRIIAKIENAEGVQNIDSILAVSDGIMVARGDLGVEMPLEEIPRVQKVLIKKAYSAGKQVITATQMLESMVNNPRPTRAETNDVANAIYDGTSAIMLSGETAAGKWPVEAVRTMARIAERTENDIDYRGRFLRREYSNLGNITNAISHAACAAAHDLSASFIIAVTESGATARMISKFRPQCNIIGCSPDPMVVRQMSLSWGVASLLIAEKQTTDELFEGAVEVAQEAGLIVKGDLVVITSGVPIGISGTTNMMRVHVVGDPITDAPAKEKNN